MKYYLFEYLFLCLASEHFLKPKVATTRNESNIKSKYLQIHVPRKPKWEKKIRSSRFSLGASCSMHAVSPMRRQVSWPTGAPAFITLRAKLQTTLYKRIKFSNSVPTTETSERKRNKHHNWMFIQKWSLFCSRENNLLMLCICFVWSMVVHLHVQGEGENKRCSSFSNTCLLINAWLLSKHYYYPNTVLSNTVPTE